MGRPHRELKPKAPLLAKDARNGAPGITAGGIASLRFAQQKMHVLGHDDIADHDKMVASAHLFEHLDK